MTKALLMTAALSGPVLLGGARTAFGLDAEISGAGLFGGKE